MHTVVAGLFSGYGALTAWFTHILYTCCEQLPEKYIAAIARQLVAGLTYLHKELKVGLWCRSHCTHTLVICMCRMRHALIQWALVHSPALAA